jgi:predicted DNA-binding protein (MmcQ/YjbR family)
MNIEEFRDYCLSKSAVTEALPFDDKTLVFKVNGKMFTLTNIENFEFVNLKCNPQYAIDLREEYDGVKPGYHMNKTHWNSVYTDGNVSDELFYELIDLSYDLVTQGLRRKVRESLK